MQDYKIDYDDDQDKILMFNRKLTLEKTIAQLQGMAGAWIFDGIIDNNEIEMLAIWLKQNIRFRNDFPLSIVYNTMEEICADGIIDKDERILLLNTLSDFAAGINSKPVVENIYDDVEIMFEDRNFVFTGALKFGTRKKAQQAVTDLGGVCVPSLPTRTDYLIVGDLGSESWRHSRFGRKIEKAINFKEDGFDIKIIQEKDFIIQVINKQD